jgi:type I restriction enzyme, S subunit
VSQPWAWRPLGDLFEIGAGKAMSVAARTGKDQVPFLRTSNVLWDRIALATLDEMSIPPEELAEKRLEPGDLLVCEGGEIGRAAIWEGAVDPMSFQNHLHRLRPKGADVHSRFYVFFLQCAFTQLGIFEGAGNKTTIPNLSSNRLGALEVPHPPLREQQAIATALASVREAEQAHSDLRSLTHNLKRAAMEHIFRQGLAGDAQVDSIIGLVPESWVVEELGENHTVRTGGTPARGNASYWEGGTIPWVKTAEVSYMTIRGTAEHVTQTALNKTNLKLFPAGTVLLAMYGQGITRGKVAKLGIEATCNQACAAIQSTEGVIDADFLYYFLEWQYQSIRSRAHGGQQQNLSLDIVRKIPIAYPANLAQQREMVAVLKAIDDKICLHRDRLRVVRELFSRLMLDLMAGGISSEALVLPSTPSSEGAVA